MASPLSRSKGHLEALGFVVVKVEYWNSFARRRIDFGGFADLVCFSGSGGTCAIQATSTDNVSSRIAKCMASTNAKIWLAAGNRLFVHGWAKRGERGRRKLWTLMERELILSEEEIIERERTEIPAQLGNHKRELIPA